MSQITPLAAAMLKARLLEAYSHLGASLIQAQPADDQIIIDHIRDAQQAIIAAQQEIRFLLEGK